MDVDIEDTSNAKGEEEKKGKPIVVILVGAPGSGKSTFCDQVMRSSTRPWVRVCQDTINNGKSGTKAQCLKGAAIALKDGKSVFIDRCNLDREQRVDFVKLGGPQVDMHAMVIDLPAQLCISRSVKRTEHEGNLQGGRAAAVVNKMLQNKEFPKLNEGFSRITFCHNETDVQAALNTYASLAPLDILPNGCFGQKNRDSKVQLGIMKFLKKMEPPSNNGSNLNSIQDNGSQVSKEKNPSSCTGKEMISSLLSAADKEVKEANDQLALGSVGPSVSADDVPTLAFPSISTADFQFNHEKASDIIVEKVEEFVKKVGNGRLVLVDLNHGSKILSLVMAKVAERNIDSKKFFTLVGDITQLYSKGGLRCNVIANAANWRLKPGGGGVNAAIFSAAGPALEIATKEQASSLQPGHIVVVPLPSSSSLFDREGVSHVIHVLGPNMNPQRPNFLNNDYNRGCQILRDAYTSLFEGFASIISTQSNFRTGCIDNLKRKPLKSGDTSHDAPTVCSSNTDKKTKRNNNYESDRSKKCKGFQDEARALTTDSMARHIDKHENDGTRIKAWGSWAQSLHRIAMHPAMHKDDVLEISDDTVVLNDLYPKAQKHLLVVARYDGLDSLADVGKDHLQLLLSMHAKGLEWAEKILHEDPSLIFRLGFHSVPSMRQLHLHVISQDFNSNHLKNKKHWNSFNTGFFCDSVDVIEEIRNAGKATLKDDDSLLAMELRCHRCRSAHPNIPRLKSHISSCRAPFPAPLLESDRLVLAPTNNASHS